MTLTETQFGQAKSFVQSLDSTSVEAFGKALADKGFPWDKTDSIPWWESEPPQRTQLKKEIKAGANQKQCEFLLNSYCTELTVSQGYEAARAFTTDEFNRSGWFQYFLYEAANSLGEGGEEHRELLTKIVNSFFYRHRGSFHQKVDYDAIDDKKLRQLMVTMLSIGFDRVPATKGQILAGDSSSALVMSRMRFADAASTDPLTAGDKEKTDVRRVPVELRWRADSRKFAAISGSQGFLTKAHSEGYAKSKSMRESWHPFSVEGFRQYMWFRKAQKDNCLYSVVSVGTGDWQAFLVYPKISLSGGRVTGVNGYLGTTTVKCKKSSGGGTVDLQLPTAETYLYLFVQLGVIFDTAEAQGGTAYPEVGMAEIPLRNIFGCLRFVRYFLGPEDSVTDDAGQIVRCDVTAPTGTDDDHFTVRSSCGEDVYSKLTVAFDSVKTSPPIRVAWASSGKGYSTKSIGESFEYEGESYIIDSPQSLPIPAPK